jgi:hypothetical protein
VGLKNLTLIHTQNMSKPKRDREGEFPDLKYPNFPSSSRKSVGGSSDPLLNAGKGGRGGIDTNWEDVKWTPAKIVIVSIGLAFPYLALTLVTFFLGMKIVTAILVGIAILVFLLFVFVRWMEKV